MPTQKKRINLVVSTQIEDAVTRLAARDEVPVAAKALELIQRALEIEEDVLFDIVARSRDTRGALYHSHQKAWGKSTK